MATKAWYWLGLGILAWSLTSSNTAARLSAKLNAACVRSMPLGAYIEMTLGHLGSGFRAMEGKWQAEAECRRAEIEAERRHGGFSHAQVLVGPEGAIRTHVLIHKGPLEVFPSLSVQPAERVIVCPRSRLELSLPEEPAAPVMITDKDPI